ncbi:MAG: Holliday junction resolvase RuvX [Bacteroidales bacterium]|jgi:putative Holliday junction resolvase|nr:Holliday junction resolvase RuvX [Bacteroidales bacterium]
MGRILGIDYGKKRVGIAVTDPLQIFASPLNTVTVQEFDSFLDDYIRHEQVDEFVVGWPVQMNNKPSESVKYIDPFIRRLKKKYPGKPIHIADERFTSQMAIRAMIDGGVKKTGRRNRMIIDMVSASIILQSFLDHRSALKERNAAK